MANILYFFPMNPERVTAGNELHARKLLFYFRDRGHVVDLISSDDYWGGVVETKDVQSLKKQQLIRNHYGLAKKPRIDGFKDFLRYEIIRFIRKKLKFGKSTLSNFTTDYSKSQFNKILEAKNYDYIIISYAFWGDLIRNNPWIRGAKTIVDTHDLITAQEYTQKNIKIGPAFSEEIGRLDLFDEIWTVSADEQYVFSQFCRKPVRLIPVCTDANPNDAPLHSRFDLIFVGGNNPHNVKSIKWFFEEVYPKLSASLRLCIIGSINNVLPDYPNVIKVVYAENLASYYRSSRIAICPMLSGTGTKVKVIEALSYGLPTVCSPRGVDGLLNKRENGCLIGETAGEFATQIQRLIQDDSLYIATQLQAIDYHEKYHSLKHFYNVLDGILTPHDS